jgi:hypothetical protein
LGTLLAERSIMWLQALFTPDDLLHALGRVTPARVALDKDDPDRFIWVSQPTSLRIVQGAIVVDARAQIRWDVLGLSVPVTLKTVSLALTPSVGERDGQQVLFFRIRIQEADLSGVPAFVEKSLVERVNGALEAADSKMAWAFLDTLDFKFKLPVIEAKREVSLYARSGTTELSGKGLTLTVSWGLDARLAQGQEALSPPEVIAEVVSPAGSGPVGGPRPHSA